MNLPRVQTRTIELMAVPFQKTLCCALAFITLTGCEKTRTPTPPKLPSIEEIKKKAPLPKEIDVKSYTEGNMVRDAEGRFVIPWRERTTCDGPTSCKSDVINEVTKEIAIKDGVIQPPWRETGNGSEIARPASKQSKGKGEGAEEKATPSQPNQ
jgi:hypothetical protein